MSLPRLLSTIAITSTSALGTASAQDIYLVEGETEKRPSNFAIPYVFPSDTLDFAFGVAGVVSGNWQPQARISAAVMGSSNESYGAYLLGDRLQVPFAERVFVDPWVMASHFEDMRSYQDLNVTPFDPDDAARAGSNGSDEDDYLAGVGDEIYLQMKTSWVLPIGHGADNAVHTYVIRDGLLVENPSGGAAFNPLTSGRTSFSVTPFYRTREYDQDINDLLLSRTNGFEFALEWDNRDYRATPGRGEYFKFALSRDWGWGNSDGSWTTWEVDARKYFSLGESDWARQRVLAFGLWTADTPTWSVDDGVVTGRAPDFKSPRLGGFTRMRAYPFQRFNDRAGVYYTAEFRYVPRWNPWANIGWLDRWLDVDWWQIVPFVEVGRVAPEWDFSTLHEDLKWDAGVGFRFMLKRSVVRLDVAMSDEDAGVWAMFSQPF